MMKPFIPATYTEQSHARGQRNFNKDAEAIVAVLATKTKPVKAREIVENLDMTVHRASTHILYPLIENQKVVNGYRVHSKASRQGNGKLYWVEQVSPWQEQ